MEWGDGGSVKDSVCNSRMIPPQKSKQPHWTDPQKQAPRRRAAERVAVEPRMDGIKSYRFLSARRRTHDLEL